MSADQSTSWTTYTIAALVSGLIGFGAIYVLLGDSGNDQRPSEVSQEQGAAAPQKTSAAPTDGRLNVGAMTTFVF